MNDYLVKAYAFGGTVRIYSAQTKNLVSHAQKIHDLWPTSAAAFGRLLTASVIMGAMYKDDQELTIRVECDGPIQGMLATTNTYGEVRGYVGNPHVFLQYDSGKLNVGQAVGNGFIHVTKDVKVRDTFTSTSEIRTGEIAEDFAYYFTASEQIPSAVSLGVKVNEDNSILSAGGFILQIMPGCKEETLQLIEDKIANLPSISCLLEENFTPEDIIKAITEGDHEILQEMPLSYACNCNKEKFERGIISIGEEELKSLIEQDGKIETYCHFCTTTYTFNEDEVIALINENKK
ncbi:MAG: Hsp33 family molecular chaperone HslO [Candidatus Izemoplasmataceae bacterium]|jgi:molecular chaperone Hsp33